MRSRDFDYIETRLLSGCPDLLDAVQRLRESGEEGLADDLMRALQKLGDTCREVRRLLPRRG